MMLLKRLSDLYYRLFGSKELLPVERLCLEAWSSRLSASEKEILGGQMRHLAFIQRQACGAKICFFFSEGERFPLFANQAPDLLAAKVLLKNPGGRERLKVNIFLHRGRFFSIEFPKRLDRYLEQHGMSAALIIDEVIRASDIEQA